MAGRKEWKYFLLEVLPFLPEDLDFFFDLPDLYGLRPLAFFGEGERSELMG